MKTYMKYGFVIILYMIFIGISTYLRYPEIPANLMILSLSGGLIVGVGIILAGKYFLGNPKKFQSFGESDNRMFMVILYALLILMGVFLLLTSDGFDGSLNHMALAGSGVLILIIFGVMAVRNVKVTERDAID